MTRTANDQASIDAAQADMDRREREMAAWYAAGDAVRAATGGSSRDSEFTSGTRFLKAEGDIW